MPEILTLTDSNWRSAIGHKPAMILLSNGEGLRGDFSTAFKKAASETSDVIFAQIDPSKNPQAAQFFAYDNRPLMVAFYDDKVQVRRPRPWGSDVPLTLEHIRNHIKASSAQANSANEATKAAQKVIDTKPVNVTDSDFQAQVIDYSYTLPVLVDFWAEWCGPCRMVAPILEKMAREFAGRLRVAKVDTDRNPGLSQAFRIMSIPTIMAFKDGQLVFNQAGAFPEPAFRDLIQQLIALDVKAALRDAEGRKNSK
ncbi:MAG: thioredoxin [Anaerolineae bacterium]|nr:thioredoxin [Anaerolineae bacterium]MDW8171937.1 thioredoxin [Anaerolineae bacterium]